MSYATGPDMDRVARLLGHLSNRPEPYEGKPGYVSRGSHAFLHFHADGDDVYIDAKLGATFQRVRVMTPEEQQAILSRARKSPEGQP